MIVSKSVFLYATPTARKRELIKNTQKEYINLVNYFIEQMAYNQNCFLHILNNNKKASIIRDIEKHVRKVGFHQLGSAYGQNAIDYAVKELHNHFVRIKNKIFGFIVNEYKELLPYVQSNALFNASILDMDEIEVLNDLIKDTTDKKKLSFYNGLLDTLHVIDDSTRQFYRSELRSLFYEKLYHWKLPLVKKASLQLDTRLCVIEKARSVKYDYVLSVKLLGSKERIEIPIKASTNGLERLRRYKNCSPSLTLINQQLKVTIPVEKKAKSIKTQGVLGADAGITDLLYSSDNKAYGSFSGMVDFYEQTVEKKTKQRSKLRALKRKYQKELKKTTDPKSKANFRKKIFNISQMLQGQNNLKHEQAKYAYEIDYRLGEAVKPFLQDAKVSKKLVAIENLEIDAFDRGKRNNKRDSTWVRGKLLTKIKKGCEWLGIPLFEVDPAYTSKVCPHCHNVDSKNRNGKSFVCTVCKHADDADHNASINIALRVNDKEIDEIVKRYAYSTKKRHKALRELYASRHKNWLNTTVVA